MKRILFVLLMMTFSISWAGWEIVGTSSHPEAKGGETTHYHDISTVRGNGVIVKMWTMQDYSLARTKANGNTYKSAKALYAYNCKEETEAIISLLQNSDSMGAGSVVYSISLEESKLNWSPIVPESSGEKSWKVACSKE
jgi:hypothetical protein